MNQRGGPLQNLEKNSPEFDQYASSYDKLLDDPLRNRFAGDPLHFHRRKWHVIQRLLRSAGTAPGSLRWLDVGCGRGELLELAGKNFAQAAGCDPSAGMLSSSRSFKTHEQPSPVELPFDDGSFSFVTAICVFHHVHGEARTLLTKEIRRVLSPGGLCCIIEHNPWNPVTRTIVKRCPVDVDAELLTASEAENLLAASGFRCLRKEYFLYLPEGLFRTLGGVEPMLSKLPLGGQYAVLAQAPSSL
jgi:SAM-dependent methyltransferase